MTGNAKKVKVKYHVWTITELQYLRDHYITPLASLAERYGVSVHAIRNVMNRERRAGRLYRGPRR